MADRTGAGTQIRVAMKQSLLALVVSCGLVFLCAEAWAWQTNISGTAGGGVFHATAVDGAGNVVAVGYTANANTGNDFTVVKLDGASGTELWRQVISGNARTGTFSDVANAVAIDGAGNVVAAGVIWRECPTGPPCGPMSDFLVVKLDGTSGAELWRQNIEDEYGDDSDPTGVEDVANAVAIDGAGDVVAAGSLFYGPVVVKLAGGSGTELLRRYSMWGGRNPIKAIAVDRVGNVAVAGKIAEGPSLSWDFGVVKLDGVTGAELWRQAIHGTYSGSSNEEATAVAVDGDSNVVAAGYTNNIDTGYDLTVVKFDGASGTELWRQTINGTGQGSDTARAVVIDGAGNVVAAGVTASPGPSTDFTVVKFNGADGTELWQRVINGTADNSLDQALAVAVDGAGNVAAAGVTQNISDSGTSFDFTVAKLDGASGTEHWRQVMNSASGTSGQARAVQVDRAGDVIAAGTVSNLATVAKLNDPTPPVVTITAPANGAIVSGTVTVSADASDNVGVVGVQFKLDGAPLGAEDTTAPYAVTWNTSGTLVGIHKLTAVARDAAGNSSISAPVTVTVANVVPSLPRLP